jgi:mannan endo-1,4-beta-mannosidase
MRFSRVRLTVAAVGLAAGTAASVIAAPTANAFPARSRQDVISFLQSVTGSGIVSGQHNKEPATAPTQYTQKVVDITGLYPGLWGGDLMFGASDVANRQSTVNAARAQWAAGSLAALTWHVCPPTTGSSCTWEGGPASSITAAQFTQIITDGTALNTAWKRRLDEAVPYFQQLKDAGVPVLFRPLHEMNESWNWWGNRPGSNGGARLYQITHDYLANTKGLSNLVWVWNVQDNPAGNWAAYYPGNNYVDVVSLDVWYKNYPSTSDYQQIQAIAGTKPIALAEMGKLPNAALLASQPRWAYFMIWSEYLQGNHTDAEIQATYYHPRVLNRGEFTVSATGTNPLPTRTGPVVGLAGKCVDVAASGTANGTAVQLYTCAPGVAQTWTVRTDGSIMNPNSGRCLDVSAAGTANGTPVQIYDCNAGGAQQWVYSAAARTLRNPQSNKCLDVTGQNPADRTRLQIWDCNGQSNQAWSLPS